MGNITLAPMKKKQGNDVKLGTPLKVERKITEVINKGGSPTKYDEQSADTDTIKQINIKLLSSEINAIKELREKIPKSKRGGKRLAVSLHDWIVEAVQEKIKRDIKKV